MQLQDTIQDALDELASSRSSSLKRGAALDTLERSLAQLCARSTLDDDADSSLRYFIALQDTFQCNLPSRLLSWISESNGRLEALTSKAADSEKESSSLVTLVAHFIQALSIIQGVALNHPPSKQWLGRRYPLQTLLDLFMTSRRVSFTTSPSQCKTPPPSLSLSSAVLDTLLCILVDSSPALRVFEDVNGVQYVVKILKRAGTPREVRMKCLEFLYFYLLDETNTPSSLSDAALSTPTGGSAPVAISNLLASPVNLNASSGTSTRSFTYTTDLSDSPSSSYSSTSSTWDTKTTSSIDSCESSAYATSCSSDSFDDYLTPVESSSPPGARGSVPIPKTSRLVMSSSNAQPRSLLMLHKDVDFIPSTPKKAQITKLGVGVPRTSNLARTSSKLSTTQDPRKERAEREVFASRTNKVDTPAQMRSHQRMHSSQSLETPVKIPSHLVASNLGTPMSSSKTSSPPHSPPLVPVSRPFQKGHRRGQSSIDTQGLFISVSTGLPLTDNGTRSMEEKKEILGGLLGNVDALVDGVRKAGIWGLN